MTPNDQCANDPREDTTTTMAVKLTPELKKRLAAAAERRCIGQGLLARRAIENLLDQLEKLDGLEIPGA